MISNTSGENALVTEFNNELKFLFKIYINFKKGKFDEHETHVYHKRALLCIRQYPEFLMTEMGPYFIKYREPIKKGDAEYFLNRDFEEDRKNFGKVITDIADEELQLEVMNHLKKLWKVSKENEKEIITKKMQNMLSLYCRFLIEKKG